MAYVLDRNFDFLTNGTVTAAGLHNLIDETDIYAGLISTQEEKTTVGTSDLLLVADSSSIGSPQIAPNRTTVYNLFEDALTGGTYVNANFSGNLTSGTSTANILSASTATIGTATITTGTYSGRVNSTLGTISNFTTTLAGDFTISSGTGTLSTTAVTTGTYGGIESVPVISVDSKGRVTTVSTVAAAAGAKGGGTDKIFWENDTTVTTSYTISTNKNAVSAGPITIGTGTVTVQDGSVWTVV
jgi:hypothetical protein